MKLCPLCRQEFKDGEEIYKVFFPRLLGRLQLTAQVHLTCEEARRSSPKRVQLGSYERPRQ